MTMRKLRLIALGCLGLVVSTLFTVQQSGAFSIRELLGMDEPAEAEADAGAITGPQSGPGDKARPAPFSNWAAPEAGATVESLSLGTVQSILAAADPAQRQALLSDQEAFRRFVQQEADNRSVLAAAQANGLHQDPGTAFLMQRGAQNILRESYLNRLIATKIPADFPNDQQLQDYVEKNREQFVVAERVHVWQIFLPIDPDKGREAAAAVDKLATGIVKDLDGQKIDFAAAALKYSAHEQSRHNGGYMGLVKVADLKPEIGKPLLGLAEGKISSPIKTEAGIHILKRGGRVAAEKLELDQVRPQVRQLLINQARNQLRAAIYEQARKSYPVEVADKKVEEWWLRLRTDAQPASSAKQ